MISITKAREAISSISNRVIVSPNNSNHIILTPTELEALSLADQALKTIEDMETKGVSTYDNQCKL